MERVGEEGFLTPFRYGNFLQSLLCWDRISYKFWHWLSSPNSVPMPSINHNFLLGGWDRINIFFPVSLCYTYLLLSFSSSYLIQPISCPELSWGAPFLSIFSRFLKLGPYRRIEMGGRPCRLCSFLHIFFCLLGLLTCTPPEDVPALWS